jgi:hypothetical protein
VDWFKKNQNGQQALCPVTTIIGRRRIRRSGPTSSLLETQDTSYNEWSHDSQYIYAREHRDGAAAVVRVRIKDRALEPVVSLKDFPQLADVFAGWIGLTPDDEPPLMRDRSVEIYALDLRFH